MHYKLFIWLVLTLGMSIRAQAAPKVVVDIAPLHSLVSQVMEGVADPKLLIPAEASPHNYALRPSDAKALANADLVFWIGDDFTPWLAKAMHNLATSATQVSALNIQGTQTYKFRTGVTFETHKHEDNHHKQHKTKAHHDKDHHEYHEDDKDHHDHKGLDPHAWLDPKNAQLWLQHISTNLSALDPSHAPTYQANATKSISALDTLISNTNAKIKTLDNGDFIVFHDAYQYFEKRFGINAAGAIALGDAEKPSPARIKAIKDRVKASDIRCVFTEPQYNPGLMNAVFENTGVYIGVLDALGMQILPGPNHYQALIQKIMESFSQCQKN